VQIIYDARIKKSHAKPVQEEAKRVALTKSLLKKYGLSSPGISKARVATPIQPQQFLALLWCEAQRFVKLNHRCSGSSFRAVGFACMVDKNLPHQEGGNPEKMCAAQSGVV
jgi:hypothetical protein